MTPVKNILILGGYGRIGFELAKLLLRYSSCEISIAGRDAVKASRAARELNSRCFKEMVRGLEVNACLKAQLMGAFKNVDLVINTIPNTVQGGKIARAALEVGADYIDLGTGGVSGDAYTPFDAEVRDAGLTFITGAGIDSGTLSAMARYIASQLDTIHRVTVDGKDGSTHAKRLLNRLLGKDWGNTGYPPEIFSVSASGTGISGGCREKLTLTVGHQDASLGAAVAAFPCVTGLIEGSISRPGIHRMGNVLDSESYLGKLWDMGMTVHLQRWPDPVSEESLSGDIPTVPLKELAAL